MPDTTASTDTASSPGKNALTTERFDHSVPSHKPVFIVGMNGSGTTMVLDHLGQHPELYGFKVETYILPHYLLREQNYGDLNVDDSFLRLWNDMRAEYAFRKRNKGLPLEIPDDWAATTRNAGGIFDRIMLEFALRDGKRRWCEKTPVYALHIERLAKALPEALFIHMLRDGRDCAASDHRRWGRHPEGTITRWKQVVSEGRRQGDIVADRYLEVRYEDLTDDPPAEMRRISNFLGVDFDERVMTTRTPTRNLGPKSKAIVKNRQSGKHYFTDIRLRELEAIAGRQLSSLGYQTGCPNGDRNTGRLKRFWWLLYDTRAIFTRQLRNKLFVQKRMTWALYFARLKSTVRKSRTSSTGTDGSQRRSDD